MRGARWGAIGLAFLLGLNVLGGLPSAGADPFHLQIANDITIGPESVSADRWVAQSFTPAVNFFVSRVSLFAADVGSSDPLSVSIRSDASGSPAGSNLTMGTADGSATATWLDVDLLPYVGLVAGQVYWIVAHSDRPGGSAYEWWNSGSDLAYLSGTAATSDDGLAWSGAGKDYSFRVFGFAQPIFAFSVTVSDSTLRPGEPGVFRVNFTNSGPGSAAAAWVNVTLPAELSYLSDEAESIGGVRSGTYSFAFTNVTPGAFVFNLTAIVNRGSPNGTIATTSFIFEGTDHNGASFSRLTRDVAVTVNNARVTLSLASNPPVVDPGGLIVNNVTVTNVGSASARDVVIEGTVDPNATYVSSSPSGLYVPGNRTVRWTTPLLDPSVVVSMAWTTRVRPGTPDLTLILSIVRANYSDGTSSPLPMEQTSRGASVRAPVFAPALSFDRPDAERGDDLIATFHYNNTGSAAATFAWANWSLGGHYELVVLSPALPYAATANGFSVALANVAPGTHTMAARLRVVRGMTDGLAMGIQVRWEATDGNGNPLPAVVHALVSGLRAPALELVLGQTPQSVESGSILALNLTLRNVGRAPAIVWLNLTLPADTVYVGDNGTVAPVLANGRLTWALPSIGAGSAIAMEIRLRLAGTSRFESVRFAANYTEGRGSMPVAISSNGAVVQIAASTTPLWPGWWVGLTAGALAAAFSVFWIRRFSRPKIEQVFVADTGGVLLAHRSNTILQYPDEDILAGMFAVVQTFIHDTFGRGTGTDGTMHAIEFGGRRILVEHGRHHYVAVVYRGPNHGGFEERVRKVSEEIDRRFGDLIPTWNGVTRDVNEIAQLLPRIWGERRDAVRTAS